MLRPFDSKLFHTTVTYARASMRVTPFVNDKDGVIQNSAPVVCFEFLWVALFGSSMGRIKILKKVIFSLYESYVR